MGQMTYCGNLLEICKCFMWNVLSNSQTSKRKFEYGETMRVVFPSWNRALELSPVQVWIEGVSQYELHFVFFSGRLLATCQPFVGIEEMIYHWKAAEKGQLFCVEQIFKSITV